MIPKRAEPPERTILRETEKPVNEWDARAIGEAVGSIARRIAQEWADYRAAGAPHGDNRQGLDRWLAEQERAN